MIIFNVDMLWREKMRITDKLSDLELLLTDYSNIQDEYIRGIIWELLVDRNQDKLNEKKD